MRLHERRRMMFVEGRYVTEMTKMRENYKAALLLWFFGDFRCGALLFVVIHIIYKYKNR